MSESSHARNEWGRFAGRDEERLADLCEALADPTVDFILCSRGGYGLQRIIDRVPPITKPIIGFSDITVLHQAAGLSSQVTLHGLMCKHIGSLPESSEALNAMQNILRGESIRYTFPAHPLNRYGEAHGPIIGGNLSVLYGLQGTKYGLTNNRANGAILLIEDIGERHYHIDRMMRNLRMSGVLAELSGMIVGQFTDCEEDPLMPYSISQTILATVADYNYPIIFDAPIGHVNHNLPVWLHTPALLTVTPGETILQIHSPLRE